MSKWEASPLHGAEYVKPRHDEMIKWMRATGCAAVAFIDRNEREAIKRIKEEADQKRAALVKKVDDLIAMGAVRKYWAVLETGETKVNNVAELERENVKLTKKTQKLEAKIRELKAERSA